MSNEPYRLPLPNSGFLTAIRGMLKGKPSSPQQLSKMSSGKINSPAIFSDELCSIHELASLSAALRSLPLLLLITKPDSQKIWIASRLLATQLRCPLAAVEGRDLCELTGLSDETRAGLVSAMQNSSTSFDDSKIPICMYKADGTLLCHDVDVMSMTTPFGKIGIVIGGCSAAA